MSSRPTEIRIISSPTPAARRSSTEHLLMGSAGRVDHERLGIPDVRQMEASSTPAMKLAA